MKDCLPARKKIRLNEYDYSNEGMYFITICTKNRLELLGKIEKENMILTDDGRIVKKYINQMFQKYNNIRIDEYVIMPNHIHMIIVINNKNEITIPRIIKQFKMVVSKNIGYSIWQKSFYEHIIRKEKDYYFIKEYIQNNIINWKKDKYF